MYVVYILQNLKHQYYTGYTGDLEKRLRKHNSGGSQFTRHKGPWRLVYKELFDTKQKAYKRERQVKSYKGGEAFKRLLMGQ